MFPATWAVWMLWTPTVQQRTQRSVFRAAIDAHVLATLSTLVQSVFTLAGSAWMLRTPAVQQRPRITRRRPTVLAVFIHGYFSFACWYVSCSRESFTGVNGSPPSAILFNGATFPSVKCSMPQHKHFPCQGEMRPGKHRFRPLSAQIICKWSDYEHCSLWAISCP